MYFKKKKKDDKGGIEFGNIGVHEEKDISKVVEYFFFFSVYVGLDPSTGGPKKPVLLFSCNITWIKSALECTKILYIFLSYTNRLLVFICSN